MSISVSVIILTHNKLICTRKCLSSLAATTHDNWELIVVDNGSTDGTLEWFSDLESILERKGVDTRVIRNDTNIGCSTARNQGFHAARGDQIIFMDNDVAVRSAHWINMLSQRLTEDADTGMVAPKLVCPSPPHLIQCAGCAVTTNGRVCFLGRGEERSTPEFSRERECQCLISACCMTKRSVLQKSGGFDEAFNPVEYEDVDLSYRMRSHGYRLLFVPSVEMYHFENVTTSGTPSLPNRHLIIKHGLIFKERWRHMFTSEGGPDDSQAVWKEIPAVDISGITALPVVSNPTRDHTLY